jgi:hypothetical protein
VLGFNDNEDVGIADEPTGTIVAACVVAHA